MSNQTASILAKLGLDTADFGRGFDEATKKAETGHKRMAKSARENHEEHEKLWKTENKVENAAGGMADGLLRAESGADALAAAVEGLHQSMNLPLSIGITSLAALSAYDKLKEKFQELKEAREEAEKVLSKDISLAGTEVAKGHLEEIGKALEKLEKTDLLTGIAGNLGSRLGNMVRSVIGAPQEKNALEEAGRLQKELYERQIELAAHLGERLEENIELREKARRKSEAELAILETQLEAAEKISQIQYDSKIPISSKFPLIDEVKAQQKEKEEQLRDGIEAKQQEANLARQILGIENDGNEVAVRTAEAKVEAAREELNSAKSGEAKNAAGDKLYAAQTTLKLAKQAAAVDDATIEMRKQVAEFEGNAEQKRTNQISAQNRLLQERLKNATPDQKAGIEAEIAENSAAKREDERQRRASARERARSLAESEISAGAGKGEAAQIKSAEARLRLAEAYTAALKSAPEGEVLPEEIGRAIALQAGLQRSLADMIETREKASRQLREQTVVLEAQVSGHRTLGEELKIRVDFEERILQAKKDGNKETEAELRKQEKLALEQLKVRDALKTPAQRRQERRDEAREQRIARGVRSRERDAEDRARRDGRRLQTPAERVLQGIQKPAGLKADFKEAIDTSTLAKDIHVIAERALAPARMR